MSVKLIRLLELISTVLLALILMNHKNMIPIFIAYTSALLVLEFIVIQISILRNKLYCIGMKRYYWPGLLQQLILNLLFLVLYVSGFHLLIPSPITNLIFFGISLALIIFLDSRKHIFYISSGFILHKHVYSVVQWNFSSIDKVYIFPDHVEFVNGRKKLKVAFVDDKNAVGRIHLFLDPLIKDKLIERSVAVRRSNGRHSI
jgi:hypothetical protein